MRLPFALILCLFLSSCASAPDAAPDAASGPLASLAWMAGRWTGETEGVRMEEYWAVPAGTVMVGLHRDVFPDGGVFFEFLRIEAREDGVFYIAQPKGGPSTEFKRVRQESQKAVFENPAHDDPQRIVYRLDAEGRLWGEVFGKLDGTGGSSTWRWERAGCK